MFNEDLCRALVASNIPLSKLSNENLRSFLQKYYKINISSQTTLRRINIGSLYSMAIKQIKVEFESNYFYLCVDETTDSAGRYIVHLLIGVLSPQSYSKAHLIASKQLEKTNALTVAKFVQEELTKFFFSVPIACQRYLMFLSEARSME